MELPGLPKTEMISRDFPGLWSSRENIQGLLKMRGNPHVVSRSTMLYYDYLLLAISSPTPQQQGSGRKQKNSCSCIFNDDRWYRSSTNDDGGENDQMNVPRRQQIMSLYVNEWNRSTQRR